VAMITLPPPCWESFYILVSNCSNTVDDKGISTAMSGRALASTIPLADSPSPVAAHSPLLTLDFRPGRTTAARYSAINHRHRNENCFSNSQ